MSEELFLGKGSKRKVRQIHWRVSEVTSLVLLSLGMIALSVGTTVWLMYHPME